VALARLWSSGLRYYQEYVHSACPPTFYDKTSWSRKPRKVRDYHNLFFLEEVISTTTMMKCIAPAMLLALALWNRVHEAFTVSLTKNLGQENGQLHLMKRLES
jgi:hypothetical protein